MKVKLSKHAELEMRSRKIERKDVLKIVKKPQQRFKVGEKRIHQSKYFDKQLNKEMLLRVFLEEDLKGLKVITVYKTSKINKYWKV